MDAQDDVVPAVAFHVVFAASGKKTIPLGQWMHLALTQTGDRVVVHLAHGYDFELPTAVVESALVTIPTVSNVIIVPSPETLVMP